MSRTDLDATTLANSLRMMAGDGSIEWVSEPIQASVLLDIADMLADNAKLRWLCRELSEFLTESEWAIWPEYRDAMHELGIEVDE